MTTIGNNNKFYQGFYKVCDAVKATLGAEGRLAVLENEQTLAIPKVTKDGVSVARHIMEEDREKLQGVLLAKQAAIKTLVEVGDNTTTTLVLSQALMESVRKDEDFYFNKKVEKGINEGHKEIEHWLKKLSRNPTKKTVRDIATVSANNSSEIGRIVAEAYEQANNGEGIIDSIQSQKQRDVSLRVSEGFKLEKGWSSSTLINNEKKACYEAENVLVVVYEGWEPHESETLRSFLNENRLKSPILVICERVGVPSWLSDKLAVANKSGANIMVVEPPEYEEERVQIMQDIALYTGAEIFRQGSFGNIVAGLAQRVHVDANTTSIINPRNEKVENKITELKEILEDVEILKDERFLRQRIKMLEGKSVTIVVGGDIDVEAGEVFDRVDDAIKAVKSVSEEGWVVGGGACFAYISNKMNKKFDNEDIQWGYDAIKKAILSPMVQICKNAKRDSEKHLEASYYKYGMGYNGSTDETSNLIKDAIIDSKKGLRVALKNAKSTAIIMLNVEVLSTFSRETD